jgi:two-component system LytT family response regulator
MKLSAIIVDDEEPARRLIREYLTAYPQVEILAECGDGKSAVKNINRSEPDLVFLDVQMPGWSGFDVLERLRVIPMVVFCTAYEQYAVQAFEVSAVDYLLKPYDRERFDRAMNRVLERSATSEEVATRMINLMEALRKQGNYARRLFVKLRGRVLPLDVSTIERIEAQGDYAQIHASEGTSLAGQSLKRLESLLDPKEFVRIHRSSLVNLNHIRQLRRTESGGYEVQLESKAVLAVSRSRVDELRKWMV